MTASQPGWGRVVLVGSLTLALLILAFFYVPHWILTVPRFPSRGVRVWLASAWVVLALVGACYAAWRDTGSSSPADAGA